MWGLIHGLSSQLFKGSQNTKENPNLPKTVQNMLIKY